MKLDLVPIYFVNGRDSEFDTQLARLKHLLAEQVNFHEPMPLGATIPPGADAVVFPQLLGEAYSRIPEFISIEIPKLVLTSEFGTVSMWDWEITNFLLSKGIDTIAPPNFEVTQKVCQILQVKKELHNGNFLVFQDNPGEGFQADIFKRFYWWEPECEKRMQNKFGLHLIKRSFKTLGANAKQITDVQAEAVLREHDIPHEDISHQQLLSAAKIYLAVKGELPKHRNVCAVGINCLNESRFSATTPCLAWNLLYLEQQMIWGCEADILSMLTKYLLHKSLNVPILMTNVYPFLMGQAALKHERISHFPEVKGDPANYILAAHCGYLGVVPQSFASEWTLRSKVLAIVDEDATAIDARLPTGDMTLAKLDASLEKISVVEGSLEGYAQFPGSDCRNGAILQVPNGNHLVNHLTSHHYLLMTGHHRADIDLMAKIFELTVEEL
jgi:hypothetical protein